MQPEETTSIPGSGDLEVRADPISQPGPCATAGVPMPDAGTPAAGTATGTIFSTATMATTATTATTVTGKRKRLVQMNRPEPYEEISHQLNDIQAIICSLQEKINLLPGLKEQVEQLAAIVGKLARQPSAAAITKATPSAKPKPKSYSEALSNPAPESSNDPELSPPPARKTATAPAMAKKPFPKDERHIILTRDGTPPLVDPRDLILALNRQLHARGRPQSYSQARYTKTGALSIYLDLHYPASQDLATEAAQILKQVDPSIQEGTLFQKWRKVKVHTVELARYLDHPELLKEEVEFSLRVKLPLRPTWVKGYNALKENKDGKHFSSVIITLPNQKMAQKLVSTGIFFSNRLHKVELFGETPRRDLSNGVHLPPRNPTQMEVAESTTPVESSQTKSSQKKSSRKTAKTSQKTTKSSTESTSKNIPQSSVENHPQSASKNAKKKSTTGQQDAPSLDESDLPTQSTTRLGDLPTQSSTQSSSQTFTFSAPSTTKRRIKSSRKKEASRHPPQRIAKTIGLAKAVKQTPKPSEQYIRSSPPEAIPVSQLVDNEIQMEDASETASQFYESSEY